MTEVIQKEKTYKVTLICFAAFFGTFMFILLLNPNHITPKFYLVVKIIRAITAVGAVLLFGLALKRSNFCVNGKYYVVYGFKAREIEQKNRISPATVLLFLTIGCWMLWIFGGDCVYAAMDLFEGTEVIQMQPEFTLELDIHRSYRRGVYLSRAYHYVEYYKERYFISSNMYIDIGHRKSYNDTEQILTVEYYPNTKVVKTYEFNFSVGDE